jgi:hypothetical protein
MSSAEKDRAARLFRQQQEAPKAVAEYRAKEEATRELTAKLRAERLARSAKAIENDHRHIVQMIVPLGGFGRKLDDMYEWHWARDIEAMRGSGWRDDSGRFYVRWCFANLITAQDFARKFGGSIVMGR